MSLHLNKNLTGILRFESSFYINPWSLTPLHKNLDKMAKTLGVNEYASDEESLK